MGGQSILAMKQPHQTIQIPVILWAQIGNERFERTHNVSIDLPASYCPELAKSIFLEPNAKLLHGALVKTGYDIMPH
jgi:hypothetical protein